MDLLFAGDAMLGRGVTDVLRLAGPAYPLIPLAPRMRAAHLCFANLECAITPRATRYPGPPKAFYFRADPLAAEALALAGVDLVSLANNHALDAGAPGLLDTLDLLDAKGIRHTGAGRNLAAASRPALWEVDGVRVGVVAYCDHQPDFAAGVDRPGIRYVDPGDPDSPSRLAGEVAALAGRVDHLIVSFHWQPNWIPDVTPFYRSLARRLVSSGARVVWGHSPHHFQGVEWIRPGVVLYACGALVDDYALEPTFRNDRQLLFQVSLGPMGVERVVVYPIELDFARTYPAGPAAREWILRRFQGMCAQVGSRVREDGEGIEVSPDA